MRKNVFFPAVLGLALLWISSPASKAVHIVLVGDSTVAKQATSPGAGPSRGWGQVIPEFFSSDTIFTNLAANGRSSKSFIDEGRWAKALDLKPDYIFILWGTNDNNADPLRHTDPNASFRDYMRRYIDETIAIGAVPVLITPAAMRIFKSNSIINSLSPYVNAMLEVAAEKKVPIIDLNAASIVLYEKLGEEESAKLAAVPTDRTHTNEEGAKTMARFIVEAIPTQVPALAPHLAAPPAVSSPAAPAPAAGN